MAKITVLLGLPGSGKTTLARYLTAGDGRDRVCLCRDDLRQMLWNGAYSSEKEAIVRQLWEATIKAAIVADKDVIIHDAGMLDKSKQQALEEEYGEMAEIIYDRTCLDVPIEECIKRDLQRPHSVGAEVIRSFADRYLPKPARPPFDYRKKNAIIVDIDGCLAFKRGDRAPLDYMAAGTDGVNPVIRDLIGSTPSSTEVIIVTGREESSRAVLIDWMDRHHVHYSDGLVFMRPDGDRTAAPDLKEGFLRGKILPHFNVETAIDDDPRVIAMYRRIGIPTMEISGVC